MKNEGKIVAMTMTYKSIQFEIRCLLKYAYTFLEDPLCEPIPIHFSSIL